jgi:multisubunit Na+/H+ antiporter MnhG subunit
VAVTLLVAVLLGAAVAAAAVSTVGVLGARDAFDRLHYVGPASVLGGAALAVAVGISQGGVTAVRVVLIVLVLQVGTALTTHATARAGVIRGDLERLRGHDERIVER